MEANNPLFSLSGSLDSIKISYDGKTAKLRHLIDSIQKYSYVHATGFSLDNLRNKFKAEMAAIHEHFSLFRYTDVTLNTVVKDILLNFNTELSEEALTNMFNNARVKTGNNSPKIPEPPLPAGRKIEVLITPTSSPKQDNNGATAAKPQPSFIHTMTSVTLPPLAPPVTNHHKTPPAPLVEHGPVLPTFNPQENSTVAFEKKIGSNNVRQDESKCVHCGQHRPTPEKMSAFYGVSRNSDKDGTYLKRCTCRSSRSSSRSSDTDDSIKHTKKRKRKSKHKSKSRKKKSKYSRSRGSSVEGDRHHHTVSSSKRRSYRFSDAVAKHRASRFTTSVPSAYDKMIQALDPVSKAKSNTSHGDDNVDRNVSADPKRHASPTVSRRSDYEEDAVTDISNHILKTLVRNKTKLLNPLLKTVATNKPAKSHSNLLLESGKTKRLLSHALHSNQKPEISNPATREEEDVLDTASEVAVVKPEVDGSHLAGVDTTTILWIGYGRGTVVEEEVDEDSLTKIVIQIQGYEFEGRGNNKTTALQEASYKALLMAPYLLTKQTTSGIMSF